MAASCPTCPIRTQGLCAGVSWNEIGEWAALARPGPPMRGGTTLFTEGDPCADVFVIRRGWALTYALLEDGRRQVLRFALPGSLLGFPVGPGGTMPCSAETITEVTYCALPRGQLIELCARKPHLAMHLATLLADETLADWQQLEGLGRCSAIERVARLLAMLHDRIQERQQPGMAGIELPLSQSVIGDATGLTAVHVCRTLKEIRARGLLELTHGRLRVLDRRRLAELAQLPVAWPAASLRADHGTLAGRAHAQAG